MSTGSVRFELYGNVSMQEWRQLPSHIGRMQLCCRIYRYEFISWPEMNKNKSH